MTPVTVENKTIHVNLEKMELLKIYYVTMDDKKYILVKVDDGVVDLYEEI